MPTRGAQAGWEEFATIGVRAVGSQIIPQRNHQAADYPTDNTGLCDEQKPGCGGHSGTDEHLPFPFYPVGKEAEKKGRQGDRRARRWPYSPGSWTPRRRAPRASVGKPIAESEEGKPSSRS